MTHITSGDQVAEAGELGGAMPPGATAAGSEHAARGEPLTPANEEFDPVSEASIASFPASDPPAWNSMHIGPPAMIGLER